MKLFIALTFFVSVDHLFGNHVLVDLPDLVHRLLFVFINEINAIFPSIKRLSFLES